MRGCHTVMDRPDSVSRVMPPMTIIARTAAHQAYSQYATARRSPAVGRAAGALRVVVMPSIPAALLLATRHPSPEPSVAGSDAHRQAPVALCRKGDPTHSGDPAERSPDYLPIACWAILSSKRRRSVG